nr:TIGR03905 family TSCPD domain-containing protein [uncultured Sellimonas sp.]
MNYRPTGVCSKEIEFDLDDEQCVHNVRFTGGCNGNLKGIACLIEGMKAEEAIRRLSGIRCGLKNTSCPDQLAQALKISLNA